MAHYRQCRQAIPLALMVLALSHLASAGPQFSRQYNTSCSTCHTVYPKLNDLGKAFQDAGFQFPERDEALLETPRAYLIPSHFPTNVTEGSKRFVGAMLPSQISEPADRALQEKYLSKLETLGRELESYRYPYRFCLTTELGAPAEVSCANQQSIRIGTLNGNNVLEITGSYHAAYSSSKLDEDQRAGLTFRAVILPALTMAVAQFQDDPQIQGYAIEISHYVRAKVLGVPWEGPENIAVVLPSDAAKRLVEAKYPQEQQTILDQGEVFLNADPFKLRVIPAPHAK